jgi:lipoprotein-releasing system ATP-binding protein
MLSIKEISKSYPQRGIVLDKLSLEVAEAETIAIMGPSGSGKTTLMNIIGLLDKPDSGEITYRDESIAGFSENKAAEYRNRNIGFVFQDHLLMPYLTVFENICLPLLASDDGKSDKKREGNPFTTKEHKGMHKGTQRNSEQYAELLMKKTGIIDLRDKYPYQISGGEAQRVAVVRALINKPSIILADEPTGALDSKNAEILGELLLEINKDFGITVILATHSPGLASKMSKKFQLEAGKLIM